LLNILYLSISVHWKFWLRIIYKVDYLFTFMKVSSIYISIYKNP